MANIRDMRVVRVLETRAETKGLREAAADLDAVARAHERLGGAAAGSATETETSAKGHGRLADVLDRERRALDPTIAALERYNRTMRNLDLGRAAGQGVSDYARLAELAAARLERAQQRIEKANAPSAPVARPSPWGSVPMVPGGSVPLIPRARREEIEKATVANDNLTKSIGLQRHEWVNLGQQANDAITMLASGSSVFQVIATQSGQVQQVLSGSQGGVRGALKEIGSTLVGMVTPGRVAFAAIAGGATLATIAMNRATNQANEFNKALNVGAGLRSGVSRGDIENVVAGSSGFSRGEGRATALAYAGAGANRENTATALGMTRGLAELLYEGDTGEARKALAGAMRGGTEALIKYVNEVRPLTPATADYIRTLNATQGEQVAQREAFRILREGITAAGVEIPLWRENLIKLGNAASDLADDFLRNVGRGADSVLRQFPAARPPTSLGPNDLPSFLLNRGAAGAPGTSPAGRPDLVADMKTMMEQGKLAVQQTRELNDAYDQNGESLRKLTSDLQKYERALGNSSARAQMLPDDIRRAEEQIGKLRGTLGDPRTGWAGNRMTDTQRVRASEDLAIRQVNDRSVAERAATAEKQKQLELANAMLAPEEQLRRIAAARTLEYAKAARETEDLARSSREALGVAGLSGYARSRAEMENTFRRERENLGDSAALRQSQTDRRRTLDIEQIGGPLRSATQSINEQRGALQLLKDSFGATAEQAATLAERQRLLNEYGRAEIPITDDLIAKINERAAAYGKEAGAIDKVQRAQQEFIAGRDEIRSGTTGLFSGISSDLRQGRDWREGAVNKLGQMGDQYVERTLIKPATEWALGRMGTAETGALGGLFGGAPIPTANMTVTAGTVTIAGVGGLTGGLTGGVPSLGAGTGTVGASTAATAASGGANPITSVLAAPFAAARSLVTGGASRSVLSVRTPGGGSVPATQSPSGEIILSDVPLPYKAGVPGAPGALPISVNPSSATSVFGSLLPSFARRPYDIPAASPLQAQLTRDVRDRDAGGWGSVVQPGDRQVYVGNKDSWLTKDKALDRLPPTSPITGISEEVRAAGADVAGSLKDTASGINSATPGLTSAISDIGKALGNTGSGSFGLGGVSGLFGGSGVETIVPAYANGTMNALGGTALVGEKGPEFVTMPPHSQVTPSHMLPRLPSSSPSLTYNEAPINSAAGVTPEQWMAARQQDRAAFMRDVQKNIGGIIREHTRRQPI